MKLNWGLSLGLSFAGSREAVLRVFEAEVVNYNTNSLADVGVSYRADKGGTIIFPRLTKWDQDLEYAQVEDGATGEIRYGP